MGSSNWFAVAAVKAASPPLNHKPLSFSAQLRPLHELVKGVDCAGVKKLHLRRALEEYLSQEDPCHCRPCRNNGQPLLVDSVCYCSCRDGTSGAACQTGTVTGEPAGRAAPEEQREEVQRSSV